MSAKEENLTKELIQKFESLVRETDLINRKLEVAKEVINSNNLSCEYQAMLSLESEPEQNPTGDDFLEAVIKLIEDIREEERKG